MTQLNADSCYIFTDTETTGLDINFSQIIQIGSLLTNDSLSQEKSQDIGCKLLPWIVPSPEAYLVHKKVESLNCLLYTSPSPRDGLLSRMPSSA